MVARKRAALVRFCLRRAITKNNIRMPPTARFQALSEPCQQPHKGVTDRTMSALEGFRVAPKTMFFNGSYLKELSDIDRGDKAFYARYILESHHRKIQTQQAFLQQLALALRYWAGGLSLVYFLWSFGHNPFNNRHGFV